MTILKSLAIAAAGLLIAGSAHAATLGLTQVSSPQVLDPTAQVIWDGSELIVGNSAAATTVGLTPGGVDFFTITAEIDTPLLTIGSNGGAIAGADLGGNFATAPLVDFGFTFDANGADTLEFLFDDGSAQGVLALVTGEFDSIFATSFFVGTGDTVIAPVVPLPAGVLLLGSALGILALRRRAA